MLKTHKVQLDPNNKQATQFAQHCGYARLSYNAGLHEFKNGLDGSAWLTLSDTKRVFNSKKFEAYEWAKDLSQNASKNAIHDLYDAIARWKSSQNRFPKFKRKGRSMSYRASNGRNTVKVDGKRILLPRIGWVRMFETLRWASDIVRATISKRGDRWFVSILIETTDTGVTHSLCDKPAVGIDVGIHSLATTDDGTKYENPKAFARLQRKLRRLQRKFSRCKQHSQNWWKLKAKIAQLHFRIACIRADAHHKASTTIVSSASHIGIESLNVSGLLKNRRLAKSLSDAALHSFLGMIQYKAAAREIPITEADRFYPSSKMCSTCGTINANLTLSDRTYHCLDCGMVKDRDVNAAINLRTLPRAHRRVKTPD